MSDYTCLGCDKREDFLNKFGLCQACGPSVDKSAGGASDARTDDGEGGGLGGPPPGSTRPRSPTYDDFAGSGDIDKGHHQEDIQHMVGPSPGGLPFDAAYLAAMRGQQPAPNPAFSFPGFGASMGGWQTPAGNTIPYSADFMASMFASQNGPAWPSHGGGQPYNSAFAANLPNAAATIAFANSAMANPHFHFQAPFSSAQPMGMSAGLGAGFPGMGMFGGSAGPTAGVTTSSDTPGGAGAGGSGDTPVGAGAKESGASTGAAKAGRLDGLTPIERDWLREGEMRRREDIGGSREGGS